MAKQEHWTSFKAHENNIAVCQSCGSAVLQSTDIAVKQRGFFSNRNESYEFFSCAGCGRAVGWVGKQPKDANGTVIKRRLPNGEEAVIWP